jgi:GMP synthase-like glutamine amidotransferase
MRILVFQHLRSEHPGIFRSYFARDGVEWDAVELDEGGVIPPLEGYDALWVMGGAMDVWDVEEFPWLVAEKRAIRHWVREMERPFLGFCLGHQLLADALGGTCGPQHVAEVGVFDVELTPEGLADPLFAGLEARLPVLQWHSVRVAQPPDDATVLASSPLCAVQAMRAAPRAWGVQYHLEAENEAVREWAEIPAYRAALERANGAGAMERLQADIAAHAAGFESNAAILYRNFMQLAGK